MSSRSFWTTMAVLAVVGVVGLLAFGLAADDTEALAIGDPTPDAPLPRLDGPGDGRIADYEGKWVLVNFWASWCDPCRTEAPALESFWRENRDRDFVVLGVDTQDLTDDAKAFVEEFGLTYPMLRDGEGESTERFGMVGFPESFLVDPNGRLALIRRGPVDEEYLAENVEPLLPGRGSS